MKYRFGGKEKRISLGVYPDVLLKEARRRRSQARQLLAREIDPSEHRKAPKAARPERSANSFEAVAREWFLKHSPHWATSYSGRMLRRLERPLNPPSRRKHRPRSEPSSAGAERLASTRNGGSLIHMTRIYIIDKP